MYFFKKLFEDLGLLFLGKLRKDAVEVVNYAVEGIKAQSSDKQHQAIGEMQALGSQFRTAEWEAVEQSPEVGVFNGSQQCRWMIGSIPI